MTKISNISCVIIAKDAQKTIQETLESLSDFEEVILYLNNSIDTSKEIAQNFSNVKIIEGEFLGFGPTKNKACGYASKEWILSIDSDEVLSKELAQEIAALELDKKNIYLLKRENHYNKKAIRCCGWGDDKVVRLFNKTTTSFCDNLVHEYIEEKDLTKKELKGSLQHYPFENASQLIDKMQYYSTLFAQNNKKKKNSSPLKAFIHALFAFFKSYILQKGVFYGYEGLLISISNANGVFYKYIKLYEENKK